MKRRTLIYKGVINEQLPQATTVKGTVSFRRVIAEEKGSFFTFCQGSDI